MAKGRFAPIHQSAAIRAKGGRPGGSARVKFMLAVQHTHILEAALRVLEACVYRLAPDETDIAWLREYTADTFTPPEELSREVIHGVLQTNRATIERGNGV